jgi:gamma-glutamylcyclotransferase (GGCT)/AIG2-like uncharacterized protein YtfP
MNEVYLFLYGPLSEGGHSNELLPQSAHKIDEIILPFKLYQSPSGNPAITNEKGKVQGSLYSIPSEEILNIDSFVNKNDNSYIRKKVKYGNREFYAYFATPESLELLKNYNILIASGNWNSFYNDTWTYFENCKPKEVITELSEEDLLEVCNDFKVDNIDEVNALLESMYRRNIMLEATNKNNEKDDPEKEPSLDDLNEPEIEEPITKENEQEINAVPNDDIKPSLNDLNEPEEQPSEELPTNNEPEKPIETPRKTAPPQPPTIPGNNKEAPQDKLDDPAISFDWKREKHLRTLYNNHFKIFPNRGPSTYVGVKFTSVKANDLYPNTKYLQANITSICTSEDVENKNHMTKYYGQWIQLRRQRQTQQWCIDMPCEVRCECKSFIYFLAYANMRNKSLAGTPVRKGKKDGYPINYTIPSNETNPGYIPALCKHLMGLTNELFDVKGNGRVKKDLIV